jgi:co-chaperonin GroES (HSP10)
MKAHNEKYLIKSVAAATQTSGGIFIKSQDETQLAEIYSVGAGVENPLPLGTIIVVDWQIAMPIKHLSTTYYAIKDAAIVAIVDEA